MLIFGYFLVRKYNKFSLETGARRFAHCPDDGGDAMGQVRTSRRMEGGIEGIKGEDLSFVQGGTAQTLP